jgi:hypothetical protein
MLHGQRDRPLLRQKVLQSGVIVNIEREKRGRVCLRRVRLQPQNPKPRCRPMLSVALVALAVTALLTGLHMACLSQRSSVPGGFTEAPKTPGTPVPQPKPTSGFLLDRRSADK